jgi:hypothetical protein
MTGIEQDQDTAVFGDLQQLASERIDRQGSGLDAAVRGIPARREQRSAVGATCSTPSGLMIASG